MTADFDRYVQRLAFTLEMLLRCEAFAIHEAAAASEPDQLEYADAKVIAKMHPSVAARVLTAIKALENDPRPSGAKALQGREGYRIRVGDYRVVYTVNDGELLVLVIRAGHRRDIYEEKS